MGMAQDPGVHRPKDPGVHMKIDGLQDVHLPWKSNENCPVCPGPTTGIAKGWRAPCTSQNGSMGVLSCAEARKIPAALATNLGSKRVQKGHWLARFESNMV